MFDIAQFRCSLCHSWFCPPLSLPYQLACSHCICTQCLEQSIASGQPEIVCPHDLESNPIKHIQINNTTKKALDQLLKEHNNYTQNTKLQSIQNLSTTFQFLLNSKSKQLQQLTQLIESIFETELTKIKTIYERVMAQINQPNAIVSEWKKMVKEYLLGYQNKPQQEYLNGLGVYIEQGRRIKLQLNQIYAVDLDQLAYKMMTRPSICFSPNFTIYEYRQQKAEKSCQRVPPKQKQLLTKIGHQHMQVHQQIKKNYQNNNNKYQNDKENEIITFKYKSNMKSPLQSRNLNQQNSASFGQKVMKELKNNKISNVNNQYKLQSEKNNGFESVDPGLYVSFSPKNMLLTPQMKNKQTSITEQACDISQQREYTQNPLLFYDSNLKAAESNCIINQGETNRKNMTKNKHKSSSSPLCDPLNRLEVFSPEQLDKNHESQQENNNQDQLLLDDKQWAKANINFLQEWNQEKKNQHSNNQPIDLQIKQKRYYDCEKEKVNYIKRMQIMRADEAVAQTLVSNHHLQLINYSLQDVDSSLYFSQFDWNNLQIIKLVRTCMTDIQFNDLLNHTLHSKINSLVLSGNNLTDASLDALLHFTKINSALKSVYLTNNYINNLKNKEKISFLRNYGLTVYI